jgi:hypothetical protein
LSIRRLSVNEGTQGQEPSFTHTNGKTDTIKADIHNNTLEIRSATMRIKASSNPGQVAQQTNNKKNI